MQKTVELLIKKNALKEVELWLYEQYSQIDKELAELEADPSNNSEERK